MGALRHTYLSILPGNLGILARMDEGFLTWSMDVQREVQRLDREAGPEDVHVELLRLLAACARLVTFELRPLGDRRPQLVAIAARAERLARGLPRR